MSDTAMPFSLPQPFQLPESFRVCEVGNTYLFSSEGHHVAWFTLEGNLRLELSINPENYPVVSIQTKVVTDAELAKHIQNELFGWKAQRINLKVPVDVDKNGYVMEL